MDSQRHPLRVVGPAVALVMACTVVGPTAAPTASAQNAPVSAGAVLEALVPEAIGGKVVVGNLAVDQQAGAGFVTAYACDQSKPLASDLNFLAGAAASNRFIGRAGQDGRICFSPNVATHIVFDANGILGGATPFPNRRTDTRAGTGTRVAAGGELEVQVPEAVGGKTVIGNLAVDQQSGPGFVTAYACDSPRPLAADLNFLASGAASNRFIGRASADGKICLSPNVATHIIFDANGILGGTTPFANRRTDSRVGAGAAKLMPGRPLEVTVPDAVGGKVVIGNLAADEQAGAGFVTGHPCGSAPPLVSDLNFPATGATSNRFIGRAGADGRICFSPNVATHLIVDANSIVADVTSFANRRLDTRVDTPCERTWGSLEKVDPAMSGSPLTDIRAGAQDCFDRLVFDLAGPAGGYAVRYVTQMTHIASGEPIPLRGGAFLEVIVRVPAYDETGVSTYPRAGSSELVDLTGFRTFRQAAWAGSQEGVTAIGLGVRARLPFRVFVLSGPGTGSRVVVDVAHEW